MPFQVVPFLELIICNFCLVIESPGHGPCRQCAIERRVRLASRLHRCFDPHLHALIDIDSSKSAQDIHDSMVLAESPQFIRIQTMVTFFSPAVSSNRIASQQGCSP